MKTKSGLLAAVITAVAGVVLAGCAPQPPTVVTTPGTTTVIHDKPQRAPNVTVETPAPQSTHTDTNTTTTVPATPDDGSGATPSTSTSTTTTGG